MQAVKGRATGCRVQVVMTDDGEWEHMIVKVHMYKQANPHQTTQAGLLLKRCLEKTSNTYSVTGTLTSMLLLLMHNNNNYYYYNVCKLVLYVNDYDAIHVYYM